MLRTGVKNIQDLQLKKTKDLFGRDKNISVLLYNKINTDKTIKNKPELLEIVLNRFNTKNNAIKRTYYNRFNDFDNKSIEAIKKINKSKVDVHDMAISDGRASVYFLDKLKQSPINFTYTGSDICMSYSVYKKMEDSDNYIITDSENKIIEICQGPFVWNTERKEGMFYFLNNILKNKYIKYYSNLLTNNALKNTDKVNLTDTAFSRHLSSQVTVENHNIFKETNNKVDVVRIMNILHYGYFSEKEIDLILTNIYNTLNENGILIEGSNEDPGSPLSGGIYKKNAGRFNKIVSADKPSRIEIQIENLSIY